MTNDQRIIEEAKGFMAKYLGSRDKRKTSVILCIANWEKSLKASEEQNA